jgi:branched-chain amino acid transport system substrate-binding protein
MINLTSRYGVFFKVMIVSSILMILIAACGSANSAPAPSANTLCGLGNGEAATGAPIVVGAVVGATGGPADFSSASKGAAAYFNCLNANGGINGRPVKYIVEDDGWNPEQAAQVAAKLVNDDKAVAMIGSTSFVECATNAQLYKDANVMVIAGVGVPRECFESENIAPTNQGPRLSSIGAAQYMAEKYGAKKFVCMALNIPNFGNWSCDGMAEWGKAKGIQVDQVIFDPATMDPTSLVLQAAAFEPDAIITTMPAGVAIAILKAAEEQDLRAKYHWFGPTSLYDLAFPSAVGSYWEGYLDVQIELVNIDSTGPDNKNWLKVMDGYADAKDPRDSFSQAGFLAAKIFTDTVLKLDPAKIDRAAVTDALRAVKSYKSDLVCSSWYFGPGTAHNANHAGSMVQLVAGGKWTVTKGCFEVDDPALASILELEKSQGLAK